MDELVGCTVTRIEYVNTDEPQVAHRYHSGGFLLVEVKRPDGTLTGFSVCDGCDPMEEPPFLSVFNYDETLKMCLTEDDERISVMRGFAPARRLSDSK